MLSNRAVPECGDKVFQLFEESPLNVLLHQDRIHVQDALLQERNILEKHISLLFVQCLYTNPWSR